MAKQKVSFSCSNCTYQTLKWLGCCPECNEWNSFTQTVTAAAVPGAKLVKNSGAAAIMTPLNTVHTVQVARMHSGIAEWDRVVGGGIMPKLIAYS